MRVVQVVSGKFHHFHLARQLHSSGDLEAIYTGYPWFKLRGEGLPREKVRSHPWFTGSYMAASQVPGVMRIPGLQRQWEWLANEAIDGYAAKRLTACDALVALSGTGLRSGRVAQSLGAKHVCDRGSTHIRFQDGLLREEYRTWGLPWAGADPRIIDKEEAEYYAADLITVPSQFNVQSFLEMGVPAEKIAKVPYGANTARFWPCGAPASEKFVVLFVGHLSVRKGLPYLLQAFARVRHPRKELTLIGSRAPETDELLRRLPTQGVVAAGRVPNAELATYYSRAHVFALPSIEEGLATVQGEALACGCPVLATTNTGAADLFDDGREGFIVPPRDVAALADRLQQLADDAALRGRMSQAALARVGAIGGWDQYGEAYRRRLRELIGRSAEAGTAAAQTTA
jgi:glycosyltransferase involved in cell wall biosynthesis